jgi:uncharacterized membrane protein
MDAPRSLAMTCRLGVVLGACAVVEGQSFTILPHSRVQGVSADGSTVTGYDNRNDGSVGFVWTRAQGRYDFGLEGGVPSFTSPRAISADGSTIAGIALGGPTFSWHGPGTYQNLGRAFDYPTSFPTGVSGDGSVIVGYGQIRPPAIPFSAAYRWTAATGYVPLSTSLPPGYDSSLAEAVSRDGNTTAGYIVDNLSTGQSQAVVWRQGQGMTILPQLPGVPVSQSYAFGMNFDGTRVVGSSGVVSHAAMWVNGVPMDIGGTDPRVSSVAIAVSDNGSVVGARLAYSGQGGVFAGAWTPSRGLEPLADYLTANGVTIPSGLELTNLFGVSGDGRTFIGDAGPLGDAFIATIPSPGSGVIGGVVTLCLAVRRRRR